MSAGFPPYPMFDIYGIDFDFLAIVKTLSQLKKRVVPHWFPGLVLET